MRRDWRPWELLALRELYPHMGSKRIAEILGRPISQVYQRAAKLGLAKTPEFLQSPEACWFKRGGEQGKAFRFQKGNVAHNKGVRMPGWAPGRMAETQFKKGQRGNTYVPIGTERINKDGYRERKISENHRTPRDWRGVHILLWEEANGPLPAGHAVVFKDGNKQNVVLENLECITRAELMVRNTIHRLPKELVQVILLRGVVKRKIRERNEKQIG